MRFLAGILASLLLFLGIALPCAAQQSSQNSDHNQNSSQSQNQSKDQTRTKSQPDKSQPAEKHPSTAEDNPFPEDISKKAATAAGNSPAVAISTIARAARNSPAMAWKFSMCGPAMTGLPNSAGSRML